MYIGICDDELIVASMLKDMVDEVLKSQEISATVEIFTLGTQLLENAVILDAVFLDIDMPEIDGIEVGKEICHKNPNCIIIMATGREDRYREAFKIRAVDFITKPFKKHNIEEAIEEIIKHQVGQKKLNMYYNRKLYAILEKEIVMIESYNGYVQCLTENTVFRKESSLNQMMEEVDQRIFFRINRKEIVNMYYIDKYSNSGIIKIKDKKLRISRDRKKEFEKAYVKFDLNYR